MIVCIIQARTGSTRLPNKVVMPLLGKPMLARQLERVKQSKRVEAIVVATTTKATDDPVEAIATDAGVKCFRGEENDVLDRFYQAARTYNADIIVRMMADCPLTDPNVVDDVIDHYLAKKGSLDWTHTPTNYPEGFDLEVFSFRALEKTWNEEKTPLGREHVTPYIYSNPELFTCSHWQKGTEDNSALHLSVDTWEDFVLVTKIYEALYDESTLFHLDDVLKLLKERPELLEILMKKGGTGYEGYSKYLEEKKKL